MFLPPAGGYRSLRAYQLSEIIYDLTAVFVRRFIPYGSRTTDQMVQAARSGKQNIAEGSVASATSKETEIKLTNVAKASLEELLLDYEDYLRQHSLPYWDKRHPRFPALSAYLKSQAFMDAPMKHAETYSAEEFCNLAITLIYQDIYLLRHLIAEQQRQFVENGGIKEMMYRARTSRFAKKSDPSDPSDPSDTKKHK